MCQTPNKASRHKADGGGEGGQREEYDDGVHDQCAAQVSGYVLDASAAWGWEGKRQQGGS